jgi:putative endopeptidase
LAINGKQTLSENIADVAGIAAAYDGYHGSIGVVTPPVHDGLSGDEQFFLAFAQNWGSKTREAALRQQVMTDSHAPGEYRAATVRNIDAWYAAFNVQAGEKLYLAPAERVRIWQDLSLFPAVSANVGGWRPFPARGDRSSVYSRSVILITRGCEAAD